MSKTKYIFGLDVVFSGQQYFWTLFSALSTGLKSLTPCLLPNSSEPYLSFDSGQNFLLCGNYSQCLVITYNGK